MTGSTFSVQNLIGGAGASESAAKSVDEVAKEVIRGVWGGGCADEGQSVVEGVGG